MKSCKKNPSKLGGHQTELFDFRSSLTPMTLQALICTQDWLRRKRINIEADLAELTKLEEGKNGVHFYCLWIIQHSILILFLVL
jgi:hypothetical protein